MNEEFYHRLRQSPGQVVMLHGCFRIPGGECLYLASEYVTDDIGRHRGRKFHAVRESLQGQIEIVGSLRFMTGGLARLRIPELENSINDATSDFVRSGTARLKSLLAERGPSNFQETKWITAESTKDELSVPSSEDPTRQQRTLRSQILYTLSNLHASGVRRVTRQDLFKSLCADPSWIDRQLRILQGELHLKIYSDGQYKLTDAGHLEAERTLDQETQRSEAPMGNTYIFAFDSQVQSNSPGAIQIRLTEESMVQVQEAVQAIRERLDQLEISDEQRQSAEANLKTIDAQIESPSPNVEIVGSAFRSVMNVIENAASSAAADGLKEFVKSIFT